MSELKPCPFCGGRAAIVETLGTLYVDAAHKKNCHVKPNTWLISHENSIYKQVKAWNRRVNDG